MAQGERKYLLSAKTVMRSSLLSFSTLPWINHNPQVAQQFFPAMRGWVTIWGHDQMPVWDMFCTSSTQVYGCPLCFGESSKISICDSFPQSLSYTNTMPQNYHRGCFFPSLDSPSLLPLSPPPPPPLSEWVSASTTVLSHLSPEPSASCEY